MSSFVPKMNSNSCWHAARLHSRRKGKLTYQGKINQRRRLTSSQLTKASWVAMERELFKLGVSLSPSFQNPPGVSAEDLIRQTRFLGGAYGMTSQHVSFLEESANSQEPSICAPKSHTWIKFPETDTHSPSTQQPVKLLGQRVQTHLHVCAIWWRPVSQRWWQVASLHLPICKEQPLLSFSHLSSRGTVLLDCFFKRSFPHSSVGR